MEDGFPSLLEFPPYSAHIIKIDMFFYISVLRGFISDKRPSNKIDMTYLYYLPFCNIFISGDKLHKRTAHYFMKKNQEFIWAPDLKNDLLLLNKHYEKLPLKIKEQGLFSFATYPPEEDIFLTTRLWDKFLPRWRTTKLSSKTLANNDKLFEQIKKHSKSTTRMNLLNQLIKTLIQI
ncbi:MAG: hypothetical protein Q9M43_15875 [Sulfurimonas sp.]|nr:hypothetical protein [Sulfurimonas sp.]